MRISIKMVAAETGEVGDGLDLLVDLRTGPHSVVSQGLADDGSHLHTWIERGVRVLKDHLEPLASRLQRAPFKTCNVDAVDP